MEQGWEQCEKAALRDVARAVGMGEEELLTLLRTWRKQGKVPGQVHRLLIQMAADHGYRLDAYI